MIKYAFAPGVAEAHITAPGRTNTRKKMGRSTMGPAKIVRILGVVLVVAVGLIPAIPYAALALAIVGLAIGYYVAPENRVTLFLIVIVLASGAASALDAIPGIGMYLTAILQSLGSLLAAAAVTVIAMVVKDRLTE